MISRIDKTIPKSVHALIVLSLLTDIILTIIFLQQHVTIVYQNIYFITIVLTSYYYKRNGILITIGLTAFYLLMTMATNNDQIVLVQATFRGIIFIFIASIVSYLAVRLDAERVKYFTIFTTTESGLAIVSINDMHILEANKRFWKISGRDPLKDYHISDILRKETDGMVERAISSSSDLSNERTCMIVNGEIRTCSISGHAMDGKSYLISVDDITEKIVAEDILRHNEEFMQIIFESTPYPLILTSMETGKILKVNHIARNVFELGDTDITDSISIDFYIEPEDREKVVEHMIVKGYVDNLELRLHTKTGAKKWVMVTTRSVMQKGERCLLTALYDITERKAMEQSLSEANSKLGLMNSITRHDIVNQTVALNGYINILIRKSKDDNVICDLKRMRRTIENINNQILFTKDYQELGKKGSEFQDIKAIFKSAFAEVNPSGIGFELPANGYQVFADMMLRKVFYNFIDNSLRHGEKVTMVRLDFSENEEGLKIIYADNGCGVSAKDRDHIFEKGYGKNTGLGLFLTKEILSITSITIVENGDERGARFELHVPKGNYRPSNS